MARWLVPWLLLLAAPVQAEFLPDLPRAVTRTETAARDAPVVEFGYDGRAHAVLAGELGLWRWQLAAVDVRWLVGALVAADNAQSRVPWPTELARWGAGTSVAAAWGSAQPWEVAVGISRQQARTVGDFRLTDPTPRDGIAFGGGGYLLDLEVATRRRLGPLMASARLTDRVHLPGLALALGQRVWADVLGDALNDNLSHQPSVDVTLRWPLSARWQPVWALHGELFVPLDGFATTRGYLRSLLGVAIAGTRGVVTPFAALDVGAGPGLLINRAELRLALGVRYAP